MSEYWQAFTLPLQDTAKRILSFVPRFMVAFLLFLLFYGLATLVRRLLRKALQRMHHFPTSVRILCARLIYLLILLIGIMVALSAINVNTSGLLASLGVAGFALGFAFKDILENFIAGILLLFARPFEIGDQVTLGKFEGTIIYIEIRSTTLRTFSEERVSIPNSQIYSNPVVNHTALGKRRYVVEFDTSLTADTRLIEHEALQAAIANPEILKEPPPFLRIAGVNSGTDVLSWHLFYWAAPTKAVEVQTLSEMLAQIKIRLYDAGVPTPTMTSATIFQRSQTTPKTPPPQDD